MKSIKPMRTKLTIGILALGLTTMSFKMSIDKSSATAEQVNGIHVFAFSKPTAKYDILGTVKIKGIVKSERGGHMTNLLTQKAKDEFPSGEAIIIATNEFEKAEVIRFKE